MNERRSSVLRRTHSIVTMLISAAVLALVGTAALAETKDLGGGFQFHGTATPVSNHRGIVATSDGEDRDVVLVWLFDHRGGYALLLIDALTGQSEEFPMPFPPGGDCPYASILSSRNKFYTHFNSHFVEFDPARREFTFFKKTTPQMAMGMTEDDAGIIWSVTYPQSGVVSFNPVTREFRDFGHVHKENWRQYQRYVAADDAGWIYFGVGSTLGQIIAFDPQTESVSPVYSEAERVHGSGFVYRDVNGKVYGRCSGHERWCELHRGKVTDVGTEVSVTKKPIVTSSQGLFHRDFPSGRKLQTCDLVDRRLVVEDPASGTTIQSKFDYHSKGAHVMGLDVASNATICGGTAFPMRFFSFDPATDQWINRESYGQWNTVAGTNDQFFVGGYGGGFLLEWDPDQEWVATKKGHEACNPRFLVECTPTIHRPHDLLVHPDGRTVVLAGTPGYGYTGGGLLFWDTQTGTHTLVEHTKLLPQHSTMSLVALAGGKIVGGTTISAGTGGEVKARNAELYVLNNDSKQLEWHEALFEGVSQYTDLCVGPNGMVFGFADRGRFFVFDPSQKRVIHDQLTSEMFGRTVSHQGPRVFVRDGNGQIFILFGKGIAQLDPKTFAITMLAESPVPIGAGGVILDGRLYYASGPDMYSYAVGP